MVNPPSQAFQTYPGNAESSTLSYLNGLQLYLSNIEEDDVRVLSLAVTPKS